MQGQENGSLEDAARELREKVARKRHSGSGMPAPEAFVSKNSAPISIPPRGTAESAVRQTASESARVLDLRLDAPPAPIAEDYAKRLSAFVTEMEKEVEMIDGKVANLLEKYAVTPQKAQAGYEVFASAHASDFVRESIVRELDRGNVLEIGLRGFRSFRILKVADTALSIVKTDPKTREPIRFERSICLVEIQADGHPKGRRELVVTFPLAAGMNLVCHDPVTQKLLVKRPILSVDSNKKTLKDRFLSLFS